MSKNVIILFACAALCFGACDKPKIDSEPALAKISQSENAIKEPGAEKAEAMSPKEEKGLKAPSNDQAIVALAKPVLACKWTSYGFDSKCEAFEAWKKSEAMKDGAADKTLVNFIEDSDSKVQWLGADALSRRGKTYRKDKEAATSIIDVVDTATDKLLVSRLASVVGSIDLEATGLGDRVKKMIESHSNAELRQGLAGNTMFRNRDVPGMFELFMKLARTDTDKKVRIKAAAAFWTGTPSGKKEDVCKLWLELAGDDDHDLAGNSAYHLAFTSSDGGCTEQWDELLSLIETKAKAGEIKSSFMASALKYLYGQKNATEAQKKHALALAKQIVENTANNGSSRGSALEFVGKEAKGGKAFAGKYLDDDEFFVKNAAKRIKDGK